jgi:polar amino acid transport system substrate-binding protein
MSDELDTGKRDLLKLAALGGAAAFAAAAVAPRDALAQLLESGIDEKSALAKVKKDGTLKIGYAQTPPWFYKDAKTGEITGIYKEIADMLCRDLEIKPEWQEVTFANATVGLRNGDFDLFGSSLTYTVPRALAVNYVGPLWTKGYLAVAHKDSAEKFKTIADFNQDGVVFSQNSGSAEEKNMKILFPKAAMTTTTGQLTLAAEPVRAKKADLFVTGDSDALLFAKRNASWARIVDPEHPFDRRAATWAVRYGDAAWKFFLDFWAANTVAGGHVEKIYKEYMERMA